MSFTTELKDEQEGPRRPLPSLSVVIPAFNAAEWLPPTLDRLSEALELSPFPFCEIVIVDDGSTDGTGDVARAHAIARDRHLVVVEQGNQGRFGARFAGLSRASGEIVLLLDSRVFLDSGALEAIGHAQDQDRAAIVWNGHIDVDVEGQPFARFWDAVAQLAWSDYFRDPRPLSYGADDFDKYPKGTGCFLAPRTLLIEACERFDSFYEDSRHANDDSSLIRFIASRHPIHLSPEFRATYHGRTTFGSFSIHAYHRGIHFIDGYFRPGTRYYFPLIGVLAATPITVGLMLRYPKMAAGGIAGVPVLVTATATALRIGTKDALVLGLLSPVFCLTYGAGLWSGVALAVRDRLRARLKSESPR